MPYEPTPIGVPRVAGWGLRLLVALAESSLGSPLRQRMARDAGILRLRAAQVDDAPALFPVLPAVDDASRSTSTPAATGDLEQIDRLFGEESSAADGHRFESIADFARAFRDGTTTPRQVAERVLEHTRSSEKLSPPMRLFIAQDEYDVLQMADAATARLARGEALGLLDGVPIAVKDEVDQLPYATTLGGLVPRPAPEHDAAVVARLRSTGAVLVGKTNMNEIGLGVTGINPHHGTVRNPFDPTRITGGSSSGSAATVAAGLCPASVGADGGGSIRTPAALCGVVGLKPTFGRVSGWGSAPVCWSVAHLGPIGVTARDTALLYSVMAGPDERDPHTLTQPVLEWSGWSGSARGVRIGVYPAWFEHADAEVVAACRESLRALREAGAEVVEIEIDELGLIHLAHLVSIGSEMVASQERFAEKHLRKFAYDVRLLFALINTLHTGDYVTAQRVRRRAGQQMARLFERVDVIATPATATAATPVPVDALSTGESNLKLLDAIMRYVTVGNLTGVPAISFPAGYTQEGLPVSLQLMGRPWEESLLLRLAHLAEQRCVRRVPRVHYSLLA